MCKIKNMYYFQYCGTYISYKQILGRHKVGRERREINSLVSLRLKFFVTEENLNVRYR